MAKEQDPLGQSHAPKTSSAYSGMFSGISSSNISKELAFATILAGAIYVDGKVRRVEVQEMKALANRTQTMAALEAPAREAVYQAAIASVDRPERLRDSVANACNRLLEAAAKDSPGITMSAYAHACDLLFTDQNVPDSEKRYIKLLIDRMELDVDAAQEMLNYIQLKNAI